MRKDILKMVVVDDVVVVVVVAMLAVLNVPIKAFLE